MDRRREEMAEDSEGELLTFDIAGKTFRVLAANLSHGLPCTFTSHERECACSSRSPSVLTRLAAASAAERAAMADRLLPSSVLFFDRNPAAFAAVLDYYRTGALHIPPLLCPEAFAVELGFWELDASVLSQCCVRRFGAMPARSSSVLLSVQGPEDPLHPSAPSDVGLPRLSLSPSKAPTDMFTGVSLESLRRKAWIFLEEPTTSNAAKMFSIVSVGFVLLSVAALVIGSLPECQDDFGEPHLSLIILEYIVIGWFTFEYVVRLVVTAERLAYVKSPLVIIDLVAIAPFYVEFLFWAAGVTNANLSNIKGALLVMRVLRVLRVARILRLARYSNGMKSCGETLKASYREVGMLVIFVCTMITMFSTTVYFMEKEVEGTKFISIPATFWWCIVTITTVGYGDLVPVTFGGRIVASLTSICGVIVLAFPITVIVENFYRYYRKEKTGSTATTPKEEPEIEQIRQLPHVAHGYGMV